MNLFKNFRIILYLICILITKPILSSPSKVAKLPFWKIKKSEFLYKFFNKNGLNNTKDSSECILIKDSIKSRRLLLTALKYIDMRIDIARNNIIYRKILNFRKTKMPYVPKEIVILQNGKVKIIRRKKMPFVFHFKPKHLQAIKKGLYKGYVKYPNIDLVYEYNVIIESLELYNVVVDLLKFFDSSLILSHRNFSGLSIYILINMKRNLDDIVKINTIKTLHDINKINK